MSDANESTARGTAAPCCPMGPFCLRVWGGLTAWIDARFGCLPSLRACAGRPAPQGLGWRSLWPSAIVFTFVVQAITGFVLWMYYSPSAQTAWESVYYVQYEVAGGWLLRGVHHYAAQVLVALTGLYVLYLIVARLYAGRRDCVYWLAVLMGLVSLGLCLTGDLLAWDQNSYASSLVRVKFLMLLPWIGDDLFKIVAGGPAFGHLTLTRFFALHVGLLAPSFLVLLVLHGWSAGRAEAVEADPQASPGRYWPDQMARNAVAWLVVMVVVGLLIGQHALSGGHGGDRPGDYLGVGLGAPADPDPANFYAAARPEWSFRGLYQLSNLFPGHLKIVPIFVLPGIVMLYVFAVPFVAGLPQGHAINLVAFAVLLVGIAVLSAVSWQHDFASAEHQAALAEGELQARRVKQLARSPSGIPVGGALSLLRGDPKTQGPRIGEAQCAVCHNYSSPQGALTTDEPSAPELYGFAGREWLAGLFDPKRIASAEYYGNTRFATGVMVRYVEDDFSKFEKDEQAAIIAALSAEARLPAQAAQDAADREQIERGRRLIVEKRCTRCHRFHDEGPAGFAPDLTGYGSWEWLVGVVIDPTHPWFYGERNDRMPSYLEFPDDPANNRMTARDVGLVADWLRGEWYEPSGSDEAGAASRVDPMFAAGVWNVRRGEAPPPVADAPEAQARALYQREHCVICHGYTDGRGDDLVSTEPSAPDLGGFATEAWITGFLDPQQIAGPKYFGNSVFAEGSMAGFVRGNLRELVGEIGEDEFQKLIAALAAEARRDAPADPDAIAEDTKYLFEDFTCTDCHQFYDLGVSGAPDLTGYGSRQWIADFLSDPTARRFYGRSNHGMPSYRMSDSEPQKNLLSAEQIQVLAGWLSPSSEAD